MTGKPAGDVHVLARRLAKNTQDRDELTGALHGLGYSKGEARDAAHKAIPAAEPAPSAPTPPPAATPAPRTATPAPKPAPAPAPAPTGGGGSFQMPGSGSDAAGFVLGILGMAVIVNYLHGGPDQVRAWLSAKFTNNVSAAAANTSALGVGASNPTNPATGVNPYDVHAAMTRAGYNAAHAGDHVGRSLRGGQVAGP